MPRGFRAPAASASNCQRPRSRSWRSSRGGPAPWWRRRAAGARRAPIGSPGGRAESHLCWAFASRDEEGHAPRSAGWHHETL
eukprot:8940031-Alexandrium_andersonii.AAC.1